MLIGFFLGCLFGGIVGVFATCLCIASSRKNDGDAEYRRYLRGVSDPRD